MHEIEEENVLIPVAMQIILNAGDARLKVEEAIANTKVFKFMEAKTNLLEAEECIHLAHIAQTEVIQNETRGLDYQFSLLFNHAQDTLMTVMSEERLASDMVEMFEILFLKMDKN